MKHYTYFRSSAAYRVRIALNLKGIAPEPIAIHLTKEGGKQHSPEYRAINPQRRVPSLVLDDGEVLMQSPAIIEYLDEIHAKPAFLPQRQHLFTSGGRFPRHRLLYPRKVHPRRCHVAVADVL